MSTDVNFVVIDKINHIVLEDMWIGGLEAYHRLQQLESRKDIIVIKIENNTGIWYSLPLLECRLFLIDMQVSGYVGGYQDEALNYLRNLDDKQEEYIWFQVT